MEMTGSSLPHPLSNNGLDIYVARETARPESQGISEERTSESICGHLFFQREVISCFMCLHGIWGRLKMYGCIAFLKKKQKQ